MKNIIFLLVLLFSTVSSFGQYSRIDGCKIDEIIYAYEYNNSYIKIGIACFSKEDMPELIAILEKADKLDAYFKSIKYIGADVEKSLGTINAHIFELNGKYTKNFEFIYSVDKTNDFHYSVIYVVTESSKPYYHSAPYIMNYVPDNYSYVYAVTTDFDRFIKEKNAELNTQQSLSSKMDDLLK